VHTARPIAPPILVPDETAPADGPALAELDAGWSFASEPAATDRGVRDAGLGYFPPAASDLEIAALVDDCTEDLCRTSSRGRRPAGIRPRRR
jgi:hypothetical protein